MEQPPEGGPLSNDRVDLSAVLVEILFDRGLAVRQFTLDQVEELVAKVGDRYGADHLWLFVPEPDDSFRAIVAKRTDRHKPTIPPGVPSATRRAYETREPYFVEDPANDPHYRRWQNPLNTCRCVAVPLCDPTGGVAAVLTVESEREDVLTVDAIDRLRADTLELLLHVLVLRWLDDPTKPWAPWHPDLHGWDLKRTLNDLCHGLRRALDPLGTAGEVAVWVYDQNTANLFVYTTTGAATEYRGDRTLSAESLLGEVASAARTVGRWRAGEPTTRLARYRADEWEFTAGRFAFHHQIAGEALGLTAVDAVALEYGSSTAPDWRGRSALVVSWSCQTPCPAVGEDEYTDLAAALSDFVCGYTELREHLLLARRTHLRFRHRDSDRPFDPLLTVITDALTTKSQMRRETHSGVTIFARTRESHRLVAVASTGLADGRTGDPVPLGECHYNLMATAGFTTWLATHPEQPVRWNDPTRRPVGAAQPTNLWVETLGGRVTTGRRVLGLGALAEDGYASVVVRVVRSGDDDPFTPGDAHLLGRILAASGDLLADWRATQIPAPAPRPWDITPPREGRILRMLTRWIQPLPRGVSQEVLLEEVCRDIEDVLRADKLSATIRVLVGDALGRWPPKVMLDYAANPFPWDGPMPTADPPALNWKAVLAADRPLVCTWDEGGTVRAGVRVPLSVVRTAGNAVPRRAVLAINFGHPVDWRDAVGEFVLIASHRVAAVLSADAAPWPIPEAGGLDPERAVAGLLEEAEVAFGRGRVGVILCRRDGYGPYRGTAREVDCTLPSADEPVVSRRCRAVGVLTGDKRAAFPLSVGPVRAGYLLVHSHEAADERWLRHQAGWVAGRWARASVAAGVGGQLASEPISGLTPLGVAHPLGVRFDWSPRLFGDTDTVSV